MDPKLDQSFLALELLFGVIISPNLSEEADFYSWRKNQPNLSLDRILCRGHIPKHNHSQDIQKIVMRGTNFYALISGKLINDQIYLKDSSTDVLIFTNDKNLEFEKYGKFPNIALMPLCWPQPLICQGDMKIDPHLAFHLLMSGIGYNHTHPERPFDAMWIGSTIAVISLTRIIDDIHLFLIPLIQRFELLQHCKSSLQRFKGLLSALNQPKETISVDLFIQRVFFGYTNNELSQIVPDVFDTSFVLNQFNWPITVPHFINELCFEDFLNVGIKKFEHILSNQNSKKEEIVLTEPEMDLYYEPSNEEEKLLKHEFEQQEERKQNDIDEPEMDLYYEPSQQNNEQEKRIESEIKSDQQSNPEKYVDNDLEMDLHYEPSQIELVYDVKCNENTNKFVNNDKEENMNYVTDEQIIDDEGFIDLGNMSSKSSLFCQFYLGSKHPYKLRIDENITVYEVLLFLKTLTSYQILNSVINKLFKYRSTLQVHDHDIIYADDFLFDNNFFNNIFSQ